MKELDKFVWEGKIWVALDVCEEDRNVFAVPDSGAAITKKAAKESRFIPLDEANPLEKRQGGFSI